MRPYRRLNVLQMEKIIAITASLPRQSKVRTKLTGVLIDALWGALQHPPMSYLGENFQYRTPDGSYNVCEMATPWPKPQTNPLLFSA